MLINHKHHSIVDFNTCVFDGYSGFELMMKALMAVVVVALVVTFMKRQRFMSNANRDCV
jgi:uncharacterized membrane protein